jgi:hypothetical protein
MGQINNVPSFSNLKCLTSATLQYSSYMCNITLHLYTYAQKIYMWSKKSQKCTCSFMNYILSSPRHSSHSDAYLITHWERFTISQSQHIIVRHQKLMMNMDNNLQITAQNQTQTIAVALIDRDVKHCRAVSEGKYYAKSRLLIDCVWI